MDVTGAQDDTYPEPLAAKKIKLLAIALEQTWRFKSLYAKYLKYLNETDIEVCQTNQFLRSCGLKGETKNLIMAVQN